MTRSATSSSKRIWLIALIIMVAVAGFLALTRYFTFSPFSQVRVRSALQKGFPGFRIVSLEGIDHRNIVGSSRSSFEFEVESTRVKGFRVQGDYYVYPAGIAEQEQRITNGIFSGTGEYGDSDLQALQRLWVRLFPHDAVLVGRYYFTGPVVGPGSEFAVVDVHPRYESIDPRTVLCLVSTNHGLQYFRLDRAAGEWEQLPNYTEP